MRTEPHPAGSSGNSCSACATMCSDPVTQTTAVLLRRAACASLQAASTAAVTDACDHTGAAHGADHLVLFVFPFMWPSHDAGVGVHTPSIPNKAGDSSRAGGSLLHKSVCMPASGMQCGPTACSASQQRALISSRLRSGLASSMPAACHCAASIPGAAALTTPSAQRLEPLAVGLKWGAWPRSRMLQL